MRMELSRKLVAQCRAHTVRSLPREAKISRDGARTREANGLGHALSQWRAPLPSRVRRPLPPAFVCCLQHLGINFSARRLKRSERKRRQSIGWRIELMYDIATINVLFTLQTSTFPFRTFSRIFLATTTSVRKTYQSDPNPNPNPSRKLT